MNIMGLVGAAAVVGIVGLVIGVLLGIASEKFKVEVDEKELSVRAELPGNNCGGCGYPGCDGLAKAIAQGEAGVGDCPVGGPSVAAKIAEIMGIEPPSADNKKVAFVKCSGTCDKTKVQYKYFGSVDCRKAAVVPGAGEKACAYGCMGYGSCVTACEFDAIHVVDGVAVVDPEKCVACGKCVDACPNDLVELIPYKSKFRVVCNSHEKGKDVKAKCEAGCIGCTLCTKECPFDAISMVDNLAVIDYAKCKNCSKCAKKCPAKVIA